MSMGFFTLLHGPQQQIRIVNTADYPTTKSWKKWPVTTDKRWIDITSDVTYRNIKPIDDALTI